MFAKKRFIFTIKIDFPNIRILNLQYWTWCMLISQNLDFFFAITLSKFFLSHLLSFFPAFLLPLPFSMHILSCCRIKKFRISFGQSLEMESWYRYGGPFYHHLCSKTDNVRCFLICYVRMPSISKPDHCSDRSLPALLNAYQDYLLIGKSMTSQVLQKARPSLTLTRFFCFVGHCLPYAVVWDLLFPLFYVIRKLHRPQSTAVFVRTRSL